MYGFLAALVRGFVRLVFRVKIVNEENLPKEGACILCMNHLSFWDPVIICTAFARRVRFIAKAELFKVPLLGWFLKAIGTIAVKRGAGDFSAIKESLKILKNEDVLGIFPTGTREKIRKNAPARSGVAFIAVKSGSPVVPVYINANYRIFSKIELRVGEPMSYSKNKGEKLSAEQLEKIAEEIYASVVSLGD